MSENAMGECLMKKNRGHKEFTIESLQNHTALGRDSIFRHHLALGKVRKSQEHLNFIDIQTLSRTNGGFRFL